MIPDRDPWEVHNTAQPRFLGEQEGEAEDDLKAALAKVLVKQPTIRAAYLARVSHGGDESSFDVALCLRTKSGDDDPSVVPAVASAFSSLFGEDEHLDIMFLSDDQLRDIKKVCRPFFGA